MAEKHYREPEQIHRVKKRRRKRRKKHGSVLGAVLLTFFGLILIIGGTFFYFSNRMLNQIGRVDKAQEVWIAPSEATMEPEGTESDSSEEGGQTATEDTITPESVEWTAPVPIVKKPKVKNILLIGQDRRPGETRARSDSMILCSINEDTRKITLVSFMRDMYVPFPGDYAASRMNHAYAWGGMSMLDTLIEEDFGITIDGNVEVDFNGFIQVMDLIAPLEIELKDYEASHMNRNTGWGLRAGVNSLTAEQLLAYARMRHVGKSDWERTERQRTVLTKAFEKTRKLSLKEFIDLAQAALPCVSTDLSNTEIYNLVYTVITNRMRLGGNYRLPVEGTYSAEIVYGMDVLVPDLNANSAYLHQYLFGEGT